MKTLSRIFCIIVLSVLLAACSSAPATTAPAAAATIMPADMAMEASSFDVSVAQYFLDSAGFHEIAAALADSKTIDPETLGKVNSVKKVLLQITWPAELNDQAQAFIKSLGEFGAALEANNVDDAIKTSDVVHDAQHELSHAIDDWTASAMKNKGAADPFKVSVAQYVMDTAGFHEIAAALAESKTIDPETLGKVNGVKKVLVQTVWPTNLNEQAQAFIKSLSEFGAALEANNVDDAIKTSDVVHDAQHELSHAIDDWAATAMKDMGAADPFKVSVAQYVMDAAGFHEISAALTESKTIDPETLGKVNGVKKVLVQTVWPTELNEQAQTFIVSLGTFAAALEANNVDDAISVSDTVHDAQHELSHAIDPWLEKNAQNN